MSDQQTILKASEVSKAFQMGDSTIHVLKGASLEVKAGEFVAIEGRSGSGKSTLLHILGSLESVTDGRTYFQEHDYTLREPPPAPRLVESFSRWKVLMILLAGLLATTIAALLTSNRILSDMAIANYQAMTLPIDEVVEEPASMQTLRTLAWTFLALQIAWGVLIAGWLGLFVYRFWLRREYRRRQNAAAELRRRDFGFIFQFYHLLPELSVLENVLFPAMVDMGWIEYLRSRSQLRQRAKELLTELGMEHRLKHKPAQLSGGERQRVAIARALMNSPKVLFADEPTGNLDAETGKQIMNLLEDLHRKKGQTIVMVTHDRSVARQADRILVMAGGKLHAVTG